MDSFEEPVDDLDSFEEYDDEEYDDELAPFEALDEAIEDFVDDIGDAIEDVADIDWRRALN